jgi:Short C-terminal domain
MMMRPMVVRRRPLLRAAAIGGTFAAGRAMGRRSEEQGQGQQGQGQQAQSSPPPAQPDAGAESSMTDQLNQLTAMHEQGALSDEEFAAAKAKVLGGG